ncbi:MAG: hypothetical protein AAGA70_08135 [Pseudomonadota bacterium]
MKPTVDFARDEHGAVTVDWVVLTAAIATLGLASVWTVSDGSLSLSDELSVEIVSAADALDLDLRILTLDYVTTNAVSYRPNQIQNRYNRFSGRSNAQNANAVRHWTRQLENDDPAVVARAQDNLQVLALVAQERGLETF